VVSIVRGKDAASMLATLAPRFDLVVVTRSGSDRAIAPEELAAGVVMTRGGRRAVVTEASPAQALELAREFVADEPGGLVVVAGSVFLVGGLRARLLGEPSDELAGSDPVP
jgi:dihydrofolate synthase/folylpolyglutamate synthase